MRGRHPVTTENSPSRQGFLVLSRDSWSSVATGFGICRVSWVATGHCMSRQCHAHGIACTCGDSAMHACPSRRCTRDYELLSRQSFSVATGLSSSSLHCVVHSLCYCTLTLFMDTVHMGFPNSVFNLVGSGI